MQLLNNLHRDYYRNLFNFKGPYPCFCYFHIFMNVYNLEECEIIDTMITFLAIEILQQKRFWHKFNLYVLQSVGRLKQDIQSKQNWKYPSISTRPSIDHKIDTVIVLRNSSMFLHVCNSLNLNEIVSIDVSKINKWL